ncbi:hypothetical protein JYU34_015459 [Plutella xylostella]|uniref:Zinc finger PHD-type domain-containing protein n=1 Tax=Plutella xylostella TaxID=51655 RepID=A0ABQ7QAV4_PLUXY|nr:hypothetical protein JYU34_015459 [Plutella xylostella]
MFTTQCKKCQESVGSGASCSSCGSTFHFSCGGITERGFSRLGRNKANWSCVACREAINTTQDSCLGESSSALPPADGTTEVVPVDDFTPRKTVPLAPGTPSSFCGKIEKGKISHEALLHQVLEKLTGMENQLASFHGINDEIKGLKNHFVKLESTLNENMECLSQKITSLESQVKRLLKIKDEFDDLRKLVNGVILDTDKKDQWARRSNIEIIGIPEKKGEDLMAIVRTLAQKCDFNLKPEVDIDFVTRVAARGNIDGEDSLNRRPKPILIKMQARYRKDDFLALLRKVKNLKASELGYSGCDSTIYANDHLTAKNKQLLRRTKTLAKERGYAICWVRNCVIMVRRSPDSPVIHINSDDDLKKLKR